MAARGRHVSLEAMQADIRARDARDSGRDTAPLIQAADAVLIDTSALDREAAMAAAIAAVERLRR